ncbi:ATP-binding protein [Streptomyces albicerus]|uniref:ATP-binding protein n=1 Tax=Streptomyces albicerus TaxID=2569859 RepID=UPI00124B3010|nr:ATP-binding protein [Streptomyces albicerus]
MAQLPDEADLARWRESRSRQWAERACDVARGFLWACSPGSEGRNDAVLLVVSELVTNAIRHAEGLTDFRLDPGEGCVIVTVADASQCVPQERDLDVQRPGGVGWQLIRELASQVHVEIVPGGKTIQAIVPLSE